MAEPLRVLILEDNPSDAELMVHELRRAGFDLDWVRVETEADYIAHLDQGFDLILGDYSLPQFDGASALRLLRERGLDNPFILISSSVGEDIVVECMKLGAADYLLKDRLARLVPAVENALADRRLRAEKRLAEEALQASEVRYRRLFEAAKDGILILDPKTGQIVDVNPFLIDLLGYSHEEFLGKKIWEIGSFRNVVASRAAFTKLRKAGYVRYEDLPLEAQGGKHVAVEFVSNVYEADHRPVIQCNIRDISERKQAEETLRFSANLLEATEQAIIATRPDGTIIYWNRSAGELYGWPASEAIGRNIAEIIVPVMAEGQAAEIMAHLRQGQSWVGEFQVQRRDGTIFPAMVTDSPVHNEGGELVGIIGVSVDITERRRAEEALRESEDRYRDLVENSNDLICTHDLEGNLLSVNEAAVRLTGYSREALLSMNMADLLVPERRHLFSAYLAEIQASGQASDLMQVRTASGETRFWEYHNTLRTGGVAVPVVRGMAQDVTERQQAEEALRESEERYRDLFENLPVGIFQSTPTGRYRLINPTFARMLGFESPEEALKEVEDISTLYSDPRDRDEVVRLFEQQGRLSGYNIRHTRKDGSERWMSIYAKCAYDASGAISYYDGFTVDITERKQAEIALRESEERFKLLFENAPDAIYLHDLKGTLIDGNRQAEILTGYQREELIGASFLKLKLLGKGQIPKAVAALARNALGKPTGPDEFTLVRKDGGQVDAEIMTFPVNLQNQKLVMGIARDISARKQAEEALERERYLMNALMDNVPDGIYFKDAQSRFIRVNRATARKHGLENPEQAIGTTDFDYFTRESTQAYYDSEQAVMRTGQPVVDAEEKEVWSDRPPTWAATTITPLRDRAGDIVGIIGITRDITERKQAEEALQRYADRLAMLREVDLAILSAHSPEEVAQRALQSLDKLVPCHQSSIILVDIEAGEFTRLAQYPKGKSKLGTGSRFPLEHFDIWQEMKQNRISVREDIRSDLSSFTTPANPDTGRGTLHSQRAPGITDRYDWLAQPVGRWHWLFHC